MRSVYETERDGPVLTIWEGTVGHRVMFPTDTLAILQEQRLQQDEARFHKAKAEKGVYSIESFGDLMGPFEYIRHNFRMWRSRAAQPLGIIVIENAVTREDWEYWGWSHEST